MAVIINDFEIELGSENDATTDEAAPVAPPPAPAPTPKDIRDIMRRDRQRLWRLRAH